jgi:hypothetical protein
MKVFLLIGNYEDKVLGTYRTRKAADKANAELTPRQFATVIPVSFISPREQKALDGIAVPAKTPG